MGFDWMMSRAFSAQILSMAAAALAAGSASAQQAPQTAVETAEAYQGAQVALLGFPADPVRAFALFQQAAAGPRGEAAACAVWQMGMLTREGRGVARDPGAAYRLVSRAAEDGCPPAMISRAVMLATGEGVGVDAASARIWYEAAIRSDHPASRAHAMRGLGAMMLAAEGGPADAALGFGLLQQASADGDAAAVTLLAAIAPQITEDLRAAAGPAVAAFMAPPSSGTESGDPG